MSRYITKYINLEKSKQFIFWNGGSTCYFSCTCYFFASSTTNIYGVVWINMIKQMRKVGSIWLFLLLFFFRTSNWTKLSLKRKQEPSGPFL